MTVAEDAVTEGAEHFGRHPGGYACLLDVRNSLEAGEYGWIADFVTTKHWGKYDINDAWAFAHIHHWRLTGRLLVRAIRIGSGPRPDRDTGVNQDTLTQALPKNWQASVWNGCQAGCDGNIRWNSPQDFRQTHLQGDDSEKSSWVGIRSGSVPLEIGTTAAHTSWQHMVRNGGLARWPYGKKHLVIAVMADYYEK